jgi:hypothetical protein
MTRVRRINVSQIEGSGANDSDVRPNGEIAFYLGNNNKLELLVADGIRTNVKSKVLNKGTFYGGDADSSDDLNRDTIKLVPDEELRREGSDQYLIIDPTFGEPGHIHIRAGGTIDQSSADLFLGGEQQNVRVSDTADRVTITTDLQYTWTFDGNGDLTFPGSSNGRIADDEPGIVVYSNNGFAIQANVGGDTVHNLIFGADGNLTLPSNLTIASFANFAPVLGTYATQAPDEFLALISTGNNGATQIGWTGNAFAPGNISAIGFNIGGARTVDIITGDYTGTVNNWIFRDDGELVFPSGGNVTFDSSSVSVINGITSITFADSTVQTTAAAPQGENLYLMDGTNTDITVTEVDFNLLFAAIGGGYSGSATHNVNLPAGTLGQRLIVLNVSTLCTLTLTTPNLTFEVTNAGGPAELIYTSTEGWVSLYGATVVGV